MFRDTSICWYACVCVHVCICAWRLCKHKEHMVGDVPVDYKKVTLVPLAHVCQQLTSDDAVQSSHQRD